MDALAYLMKKASLLQEADILKSRLVNSNAKLASLQFELVELKQASRVTPTVRSSTTNSELLTAEMDAVREALRNSKATVLAVNARNAKLEAQLKVLGEHQLFPASSPNQTECALKPPSFSPTALIPSSSGSSDMTLMPSSNHGSRLPLTLTPRLDLPSTSSVSMIATPSGSSHTHTLNTPNGTPITPPLVSHHRRISPLRYSLLSSARSPLEVRRAARRSVFSVGVRTPECVFKGKVRARVSRSTRKALREKEKENVGVDVQAVEIVDVDEVE